MNKTNIDTSSKKTTVGYKATYALIRANGKLYCAWCNKNLFYMGSKRTNKHLSQHE